MKVKLNSDDRCAIDLVLEKHSDAGTVSQHCYGKSSTSIQKRVKKVERLLGLIEQMPAGDPPSKLVASTMNFIETNAYLGHPVTAEAPRQSSISHAQLHRPLQ
jgi:hypothetical protein